MELNHDKTDFFVPMASVLEGFHCKSYIKVIKQRSLVILQTAGRSSSQSSAEVVENAQELLKAKKALEYKQQKQNKELQIT